MTTNTARRVAPQSFSAELRRAIELSGLTHYTLGKQADVDPGMISRFAAGQRSLTTATLDRLAAALGVHLTMPTRRAKARRKARVAASALPRTMAPEPGPDLPGDGAEIPGESQCIPMAHSATFGGPHNATGCNIVDAESPDDADPMPTTSHAASTTCDAD